MSDSSAEDLLSRYPLTKTSGRWAGFAIGLLAGVLIFALWIGGLFLLGRSNQVVHWFSYTWVWMSGGMDSLLDSLPATAKHSRSACLWTPDQLQYQLWRYGNRQHQYDACVKGGLPAYSPLYSAAPPLVFVIPGGLLLIFCWIGFVLGLKKDNWYNRVVRGAGFHLDGARLINIETYEKGNRGDGISYQVYPRKVERKVFYL